MLQITIPAVEYWDNSREMFISAKSQNLCLEHSLVSLSKWEAKWKKPFLSDKNRTREELIDYIRCMTITQNVDATCYLGLTEKNLKDIEVYITDPMTATTFSEDHKKKKGKKSREIITSELIYYWMVMYNIPFSCEKWHLNRLMTLINICSVKQEPPKKMSRSKILQEQYALNAQRRKMLNTRG